MRLKKKTKKMKKKRIGNENRKTKFEHKLALAFQEQGSGRNGKARPKIRSKWKY
jgi:hypothetical protein